MLGGADTWLPEVELDPSGAVMGLFGGGPECQCAWLGL